MPFKKIAIPPGIDRESTQDTAETSWYDANNIRWRDKYTQTIGGWEDNGSGNLQGIGRGLKSWTDFSGNTYQCVGTTFKYYMVVGTDTFDITPVGTPFPSLTNPITTESGTSIVKINCGADHNATINDFVVFNSVATAVGGMNPSDFTTEREGFQIHEIVDDQNFKVKITGATASSTATGGGSVDLDLLVSSGSLAPVLGSGFGVGTWGGDDYFPTSYPTFSPYVTTVGSGSSSVVIHTNGLGGMPAPDSSPSLDWIYVQGMTGVINGFDTEYLNNKWWQASNSGGDSAIDVGFNITGLGGTGGGSAGTVYMYDADSNGGEVLGATRGWNDGSDVTVETSQMRTVSIQNFGEDLMFANRGGPIYYFDVSAKTDGGVPIVDERAVEIDTAGANFTGSTGAPSIVDGFIISEGHGHTIAWGCNDFGATTQNNMLIRWSDRHNPFVWTPSHSTEAGGEVLRHGSKILGGIPTKDEIVFFTDSAVYSMRYVGFPEVYGVSLVTSNVTSFSRMSAVAVDNSVYFMGNEQFYVYNGNVEPLPKNLSNYVFENMNEEWQAKVFAGVNSAFTEVYWFYPDTNSFECNRYVSYNYSTGAWGMGDYDMSSLSTGAGGSNTYNRTSWQDAGVFSEPLATYVTEYGPQDTPETQTSRLAKHETGTSGFNGATIEYSIESGEVDLLEGDRYAFYDKIIPDMELFDVSPGTDGAITAEVIGRDLPGKAQKPASGVTVQFTDGSSEYAPDFNATSIRGRGRTVSIKIRSNAAGFGWRMGDMRVRIRPDGRD